MKKGVLFLCLFVWVAFPVFALQNQKDTIYANFDDSVMLDLTFDTNLDSLLNLYYINQALADDPDFWTTESDSTIPSFSDSVYISRLFKIPSIVDLTYNSIVRRYIEVYTAKRRKAVEVMLGLSQYYFPMFDDIFDYYGIPNELKYLSVIESALNPRAYSRARAVGIWQFMYGTGRLYGLTVNSLVDDRRDPIKSTHAAAQFMRDLYNIYKDWTLVIAAYNCGPGNVNKAIRRSGGKKNYWDIYYYLPRETRGYVPAYIAATYVMNYYKEHNLRPMPIELPLANDTIMVTDILHLSQVSEVLGIPLQLLRDMNPQYRTDIIPAHDKPMALILPQDQAFRFIEKEKVIYSYKDSVFFNADKMTTNPTVNNPKYVNDIIPPENYAKLVYTVKSGDNLGYIADWYHVRISDIKYWNNLRYNTIRAGQKLAIYVPKNKVEKYGHINKLSFEEKQKMIGKSVAKTQTQPANNQPAANGNGNGNYVYYVVKQGDTLWDIAKNFPGVTDSDIMNLNNLSSADKIYPGQKLKIKPK
jgi:membrane-bound lytic murein transglycosylase D